MSEVKFKLAAGTNVGLIRQNNEDNFVVCSDLCLSNWIIPQVGDYVDLGQYGALLVVADGMGGANAGEVASAIAVDTIQSLFVPEQIEKSIASDKSIQEFMKSVVKSADLNILHRSQEDSSTLGMGTTVVMAWIINGKAFVCWCGDSRCYVLNKRNGLIQLSKDHSYVQELVDKGELDPELMHDHPLSNVITRCLGDVDNRANPETRVYQLHNDDIIMLCSDGLCGLCHDGEILDVMIKFHEDPISLKNELISAALSAGGYDNVTVAIANIQTDEEEDSEEVTNDDEKAGEDSAEDKNEEELSTTIRNEAIDNHSGKHVFSHTLMVLLILLLILLIAIGAYFYYTMGGELFKKEMSAIIGNILSKIKQVLK